MDIDINSMNNQVARNQFKEDGLASRSTEDESSALYSPCSDGGDADSVSLSPGTFDDAPLLKMFQQSMLLLDHNSRVAGDPFHDLRGNFFSKRGWKPSLPTSMDLTSILRSIEMYWSLWPTLFKGSDQFHFEDVSSAKQFILDSLDSKKPVVSVKALLWLSLCIQQLPKKFESQHESLPASPEALLDEYISASVSILSSDALAGTIDGLQCFMLLSKLYLNMGKPRGAWLVSRRALDFAILLGLHHVDENAEKERTYIWAHLWLGERQLSSILGVPSAVVDTMVGVSEQYDKLPVEARLAYILGIIDGRLIDRDQNCEAVEYSVTMQIDQQLEQCRKVTFSDWWDYSPDPSTPLGTLYGRQVIKMHFYLTRKQLHLPYMLKASFGENHEYSRNITLDSSREIIRCFQALRDASGPKVIICDLLDFQAFSAALVLVINLLLNSLTSSFDQVTRDWKLVIDTTQTLKSIAETLSCKVAAQATQLLEYLTSLNDCTYSGPEEYEAVIPYFGKVRISQPRKEPGLNHSDFGAVSEIGNPPCFGNRVEFSTNSFTRYPPSDYLSESELGVDWASTFTMAEDYDWTQVFEDFASK